MIRYIQFRTDIVIPGSTASRSFNAWTHEKHSDFIQPEELANGDIILHEIKTDTVYVKGVALKEHRRTGKRWKVTKPSIGWVMEEDDKTKAKA